MLDKITSSRWGIHLFIGGIVLIVFGVCLGNGYSLDDNFVLNERTQGGFDAIPDLMTSHYYNFFGQVSDYRPVVLVSFAIEHDLHGNNMVLGHLSNLVLYFFVLLLAYKFLDRLFPENKLINLLAIAIFAVHPLHVEVVASLKNRDELLSSLFGFAACLVFLKDVTNAKIKDKVLKWVLIYALLLLSFFSKSTAFMFVGIMGLSIFVKEKSVKETLIKSSPLIIPLMLNKLVRGKLIGSGGNNRINTIRENPLYIDPIPILDRIPLASHIVTEYLGLFIWPEKLRFYYGYNQVALPGWGDSAGIVGISVVIAIIALCYYFWKKHIYLAFGLLFFLGTSLLVSNLLKPLPGIMAERFVFVPILGLSVALAYGLYKLYQVKAYKGISKFAIILIVVLLAGRTVVRNAKWDNILSLMEADIDHMENSAMGNYMYAEEITNNPEYRGMYTPDQMVEYYSRAYKVDTNYKEAYFGAGMVYANMLRNTKRKLDENPGLQISNQEIQRYSQLALDNFSAAVTIDTLFPEAIYGIGVVSYVNNNYDVAAMAFEKAYDASDGRLLVAHEELLRILIFQRKFGEALSICWKGIKQRPKQAMYYRYAGEIKTVKSEADSAMYYYQLSYKRHQSPLVKARIDKLKAEE